VTAAAPRVIESKLRGFSCAYSDYVDDPYQLGEFVVVREGRFPVIGVVSAVESGPEDPSRPLLPRGAPGVSAAEVLTINAGMRELLRTEVGVVACGYFAGDRARPGLPPLPTPLLAEVELAASSEIGAFASDCAFLERLIFDSGSNDSTVTAALRRVALALKPGENDFLVGAGKELARLLRADPARLATILRGVVD